MSVKRYEWIACDEHSCHCDVVESAEGDMVDYEDYAALEQRLIESERYGRQTDITIDNLEMKLAQMAAENAASNDRLQKLIQIISNADNSYCMCGDAMENHTHGGCGHPTGMFDYNYNQWLESGKETPVTAAFLAEVRAGAVDEVCLKISNAIVNCYQDEQVGLDAAATICGDFAAQLRKGVQS